MTAPINSDEPRRIAVFGASVRWAAQSLNRAGYEVLAYDTFGDQDTQAAAYRWTPWRFPEAPPSHAVKVGGCGFESNTDLTDTDWRHLAGPMGLNRPPTRRVDALDAGDLKRFRRERRWLIKQFNGTGGLGVRWLHSMGPDEISKLQPGDQLQRWVAGRPMGLVALADCQQTTVLGVCRGLNKSLHRSKPRAFRPFAYAGSLGPLPIDAAIKSRLSKFADAVANRCELRGLFNLDFVVDPSGRWWFLECNSRPSASCELIESDLTESGLLEPQDSLMRWHVDALSSQQRISLSTSMIDSMDVRAARPLWVKRVLYAPVPFEFSGRALPKTPTRFASGVDGWVSDLPADGTFIPAGQPAVSLQLKIQPNHSPGRWIHTLTHRVQASWSS